MSVSVRQIIFGSTIRQIVFLVTAALLLAQGIGFLLLVTERDRWQFLDAVGPGIAQFVATAEEIDRLPAAQRAQRAFMVSRPERHFILLPDDAIARLGLKRQSDLEARLRSALDHAHVPVKAVVASSAGFSDSPPGNRPFPLRLEFRTAFARPLLMFQAGGGPVDGPPIVQAFAPGGHAEGFSTVQTFGLGEPVKGDPIGGTFPPGPIAGGASVRDFPAGLIAGGTSVRAFPPGHDRFFSSNSSLQELDFSVQLRAGDWLNGQFIYFRPSSGFMSRLALAELILFALVLAVTILLAIRLARPLLHLASVAEVVGPNPTPSSVPESGPSEVRAAIRSFNAMTKRVADLLREKDRMLGAIGHEMRTPLASLRLTAESVEPPSERQKMIELIDDMTQTVCEIVDLARVGHSDEPFVAMDLSALADSVVEEFRTAGRDAAFVDSPRAVVNVQALLTRRLLRNLIDNAIKFGARARVSVEVSPSSVCLVVSDDGPGIPPESQLRVFEPFARLESSRNRSTGGIGLGLSIAQEIARNQGAQLSLQNGAARGLIARLEWQSSVPPRAHSSR